MSRKRRGGGASAAGEPEELLDGIAAAGTDDEKCRAFARAFARVSLPADAFVIGEPVEVTAIAYDGNPRRGLTATGKDSVQRAIVPRALCEELAAACDNGVAGQSTLGVWFTCVPATHPVAEVRE